MGHQWGPNENHHLSDADKAFHLIVLHKNDRSDYITNCCIYITLIYITLYYTDLTFNKAIIAQSFRRPTVRQRVEQRVP